MPYTSVPPLTGSPSSSRWCSPGPGAGVAAPESAAVVVADPPDEVAVESDSVELGSDDVAADSASVGVAASVPAMAAVLAGGSFVAPQAAAGVEVVVRQRGGPVGARLLRG